MKFIVGRNRIVYEVYKSILNSEFEIINIYNNGNPYELNQLADIIIEYLRERINNQYNDITCSLNGNLEMKKDKTFQEITPNINENPLNFTISKSGPIQSKVKLKYKFIKNILKNNEELNNFKMKEKSKYKNIYFLIVVDDNLINDLFDKIDKNFKIPKLILFSNHLISGEKNEIINKFNIKNLEMKPLKFEDYQIQYQTEKIKKNQNDFDSYIKEKMLGNKDLKMADESTIKDEIYEIIFLFHCIKLEIYKYDLETMFPDKIDNIENIIENNLNIIIDKKEKTYKKIIRNNNFDVYFENCQNKIKDKIKQNILLKFFEFYSIVFRYLIEKYKNFKKNDKYIEFYANSYSAIIELSKWLNFKYIENNQNEEKYISKIKNKLEKDNHSDKYNKYFYILAENFTKLFRNENIDICMKNIDIWNKVKEYIEDISITFFTCLKMFDINIDILKNTFSIFQELFKENNDLIYARLILMRWIHFNNLNALDDLDINIIGEKKSIEDDLPKDFAKLIININKIKEVKEIKKFDENIFVDIYKNKVKLVFYKYKFKIKNEICKDEDLKELKNIAKIFQNDKFHYYEIETFLLISEWYLRKYKSNINIENIDNLENSRNYLNFVIYLSDFYKNMDIDFYKKEDLNKITDYSITLKEFKKNKNEEDKEKIIEKLKILCNEYNYEYKDTYSDFYY